MDVRVFMNETGRFYRAEAQEEGKKAQPANSSHIEKSVVSQEAIEALDLDPIGVDQHEWDVRVAEIVRKKQAG